MLRLHDRQFRAGPSHRCAVPQRPLPDKARRAATVGIGPITHTPR